MTPSPPMERWWIAAAGHRPGGGSNAPYIDPRWSGPARAPPPARRRRPAQREIHDGSLGSDPLDVSILGPDDPSRNEPLPGAGDRPDWPSVIRARRMASPNEPTLSAPEPRRNP